MSDGKIEHIFDQQNMEYGSETGNWFGQCKDCGVGIAVYTGARASRPEGAKREEKIHSMTDLGCGGVEVLHFDLAEFIAGDPNKLVRYPVCGRAPL